MFSLFVNTLRLLIVIAALIWAPGWLACRRPLRPVRLLQPALFGTGIHVAALVVTSFLASGPDRAAWILPIATYAIAIGMRVLVGRVGGQIEAPTPLPRGLARMVAALVGVAAVLRALHNYHYDDLQHLYYITELERLNYLFPYRFYLDLGHGTLPFFGSGSVMLSRYPYWAVSYALFGRIGGVPAGDVYLLLGLCVLALVLAQMSASLAAAWSTRAAAFLVLAVIASAPYVSDSLLNYGGYPFQSGKLFIILAGASVVSAWRTRRGRDLIPAAVGLFVGPLLHTNNAIGLAAVLVLVVPLVVLRSIRREAIAAVASTALLGVAAGGAVLTSGFVRWVPDATAPPAEELVRSRTPGVPTATVRDMPAPQTAAPPVHDPVSRRAALFLWRGTPLEVAVLVVCAMTIMLVAAVAGRTDGAWLVLGAAAAAVIIAASATANTARQVVTSALKPGYFQMRSTLIAMTPAIDATRALYTDPITDVLGRAAGWPVRSAPALGMRQQSLLLLLLHPGTTGKALDQVLASIGPATIVVNEQVVGAGVARKFRDLPGVRETAQFGAELPSATEARDEAVALVDAIYRLEFEGFAAHAPSASRELAGLFWGRPATVFVQNRPKEPFRPGLLGPALRDDGNAPGLRVDRFLNSALVTLPHAKGCADGVGVTLRNLASFDSSLLVWPLDSLTPALSRGTMFTTLGATGSTATLRIDFGRSLCDIPPISLLIHSTYWWDYRFAVESIDWNVSRSAE